MTRVSITNRLLFKQHVFCSNQYGFGGKKGKNLGGIFIFAKMKIVKNAEEIPQKLAKKGGNKAFYK